MSQRSLLPDIAPEDPGTPAKPRRRRWVWFFVVLVILTVASISIQIWYNLRQQLTPEQLAEARARWSANGPRNYDMEYTVTKISGTDTFAVKVRQGKAVSVMLNDQLLKEERLLRDSEMPALFGFIEEFLEQDAQPGKPRTFATATFDPHDGHLQRYIRSVRSNLERVDIRVTQFTRVSPPP